MKRKILYFGILMTLLCSCSEKRSIGIINNQLNRCPGSPNCVSSSEPPDSILYVAPIDSGTRLNIDAIAKIIITTAMKSPRVTLVTNNNHYLHFEFRTFLGFVDDVEFYINDTTQQIYFRSASRIGYYDFKKNYNRYQKLKESLEKALF